MNNTPLKDLGWFSFASDLNKLGHLSIFQAVAYIMRKEPDLESLGVEYERTIHKLEIESADEIYEYYGETSDQYSSSNVIKLTDQQEFCIPESEVKEDLTLLNDNRIAFTINMGAPISVIYTLLLSEINKYVSDPKKVTLKIIPKSITGFDTFYFSKKDLKDWKSLSTIKYLGLLDANLRPMKDPNEIKLEKHQKYIGMLIHLLAYQSLYADKVNVKFTKSSDVNDISYNGIIKFFIKNFLVEDKTGDKRFPCKRTVDRDLKAAYKFFRSEAHLQ